jgi:hypothetical protein
LNSKVTRFYCIRICYEDVDWIHMAHDGTSDGSLWTQSWTLDSIPWLAYWISGSRGLFSMELLVLCTLEHWLATFQSVKPIPMPEVKRGHLLPCHIWHTISISSRCTGGRTPMCYLILEHKTQTHYRDALAFQAKALKKNSQHWTNLVRDERSDLHADPHRVVNRQINYFCQLLNVQGGGVLGRQKYIYIYYIPWIHKLVRWQ